MRLALDDQGNILVTGTMGVVKYDQKGWELSTSAPPKIDRVFWMTLSLDLEGSLYLLHDGL